jgi:hypothetical protein
MHLIGTMTSMIFVFDAVGVLVGSSIAGAILNGESKFRDVQVFGGEIMLVGAGLLLQQHRL